MNIFLEKFKNKSNAELQQILDNSGQYSDQALEAARELLGNEAREPKQSVDTAVSKLIFPTDEDELPQLRYVGYACLAVGLFTLTSNWVVGLVVIVVSLSLILVFRPVQRKLDIRKRTVSNMSTFSKEVESFDRVEKLELSSTQVSQRVSSRGSSSVIRYELYRAFLISGGQRILLGESKKREELLTKLNQLAVIEKVEVNEEK
ncbi:hypothetical protein [Reichenbachiella ulvae]|uniref:Uncharacterized protein n=1 Tax=Reichenbachiella ulvae TaxID=2980104 RepID=A0ABT3CTZ0_9BACT|nr:hypothetical protein [Reichenbachiella ulvae]MCV9387175.1 hypothetical protein [Reichenbachiella ulvae]